MHVAFETTFYLKGSHVLLRDSHIFVVLILLIEISNPIEGLQVLGKFYIR